MTSIPYCGRARGGAAEGVVSSPRQRGAVRPAGPAALTSSESVRAFDDDAVRREAGFPGAGCPVVCEVSIEIVFVSHRKLLSRKTFT